MKAGLGKDSVQDLRGGGRHSVEHVRSSLTQGRWREDRHIPDTDRSQRVKV